MSKLTKRCYNNVILFSLSHHREPQGVLACCNPVPTLVKQHVNEIHMLIMEAKETPLNKVRWIGGTIKTSASSFKQTEPTNRNTITDSIFTETVSVICAGFARN